MAFNFQAATVFSGTDKISNAVRQAQSNTEKSAGKMGKSLDNTGRRAESLRDKLSDVGKIAAGVTIGNLITKGISAAARQIKGLVTSIGEYADRVDGIRTTAQKIGLGVQDFQRLQYAAESNGVSVDKLSAGFLNLNKSLGAGTLMKHLEGTNTALAKQVRQAKTNTDIFNLMADALSRENDVAKRAALGANAFGKSWAELYPLLSQGSEAIARAGENIPHIISDRDLAAAKLWNSTLGEVKKNVQGFGDVLRNAVINVAGKYLLQLNDWIKKNKEWLKQKIAETVQKIAKGIKDAVTFVQKIVKFFQDWGKTILIIGGAVAVLWGIVSAIIAISNAITAVKGAMSILNIVMAANPIGIIVTAVGLLILGFIVLTKKVGGLGPAFEVVGQTMIANLLIPLNYIIDAVQGLTYALSHVPGMDWAKITSEKIGAFQDKMNLFLTGGTATTLESAVKGAKAGYGEGGIPEAVKGAAKELASPLTQSYTQHREKYLKENPEDDSDYKKWNDMIAAIKEGFSNPVPVDVNVDLNNPSGNGGSMGVRWSQMGLDMDYWETAKLGI
jgi:hypothetical protein